MRWIKLRLHAPLASFGGVSIDGHRTTREFPTQSAITGLVANALGFNRDMRSEHQALQERIVAAYLHEEAPEKMTDYQTANLRLDDVAWTTDGTPTRRLGAIESYQGQHLMKRDYIQDLRMTGVLSLKGHNTPNLDDIASALQEPARMLFLGRKACIPSAPLFAGFVDASDALEALQKAAPKNASPRRAQWPESNGDEDNAQMIHLSDERNWLTGLHGGSRCVNEGYL